MTSPGVVSPTRFRGRFFRTAAAAFVAICELTASQVAVRADALEQAFDHPPATAKPMVYWFWMGRNVTREGITGDLEALAAAGFGGATMCNLSDTCTPWSGVIGNSPLPEMVPYVSDAWWELLRHAAAECDRLGLEFGFHNCPGYESSGGPWITPELSMQEICYSETVVEGAAQQTQVQQPAQKLVLPRPKVDPRARMEFPILNEDNGLVEKPIAPARQTYYRDIAALAMPAEGAVAPADIVDVSAHMAADGTLSWVAPPGRWIVYRFGHTTRGTLLQPAPWKAAGLECDKMNPEAVAFHMNHILGEIQTHLGDQVGHGLDFLWFDSYEAGAPNWTPRMSEEFQTRRGYDLMPYLATFAKRVIGSEEDSKRFRKDFDRTIADLYRDVNFAINRKLANAAGLQVRSEPYGGPWVIGEAVEQFDQCAGEFWFRDGGYQPWQLQDVVAGCRKLGQNIVLAEAFTSAPTDCQWNETPAMLKPVGDAAFCDGVNRLMLHRFTHQPFAGIEPGYTMGQWGTHFDRTQTWWEPGRDWVEYLSRCQAVLQWGSLAASVADDFTAEGEDADSIKFVHRHGREPAGNVDAYFVANLARERRSAQCTFAVAGRQPELWDPVTGAKRALREFTVLDGRTTIALDFAEAQSWFVVFRKPALAPQAARTDGAVASVEAIDVTGPWQVAFDSKRGGPAEPIAMSRLADWTANSDPAVRYYSGTAVYRTTFAGRAGVSGPLLLELGVVHELARVRLNGVDLGVVWTAPWHVAIPQGALKDGVNELEIEVTNCWANRLIGDEQQPPDCEWSPGHHGNGGYLTRFPDWFVRGTPRPSAGRVTFTTWNYFTKDSPLLPSGLLGPVRIVSEVGPRAAAVSR